MNGDRKRQTTKERAQNLCAKLKRRDIHLSGPSVSGGAKITRGKYANEPNSSGAAGLIVRKSGQSSGASLMTCAHVLGHAALVPNPDGDLVYSPELSTFLDIECNNPFGQVDSSTLSNNPFNPTILPAQIAIGQENFGVDAALVQIANNATATNVIPKIGTIAGVRDLISEWSLSAAVQNTPNGVSALSSAQQIAVRKYGPITELTTGKAVAIKRQTVYGSAANGALVLEIQADSGQKQFSQQYDLDMARFIKDQTMGITTVDQVVAEFKSPMKAQRVGSPSSTSIQVQGPTFSQQGDSGSPIVDQNKNVIGLVASGTFITLYVTGQDDPVLINTGNTQAIFVAAALQFLNVTFLAAGQQTSGESIVVPGLAISPNRQTSVDWSKLERAWSKASLNPSLFSAVRRNFEEVRQLVHYNRRVKLAWHRNKGPAFTAAFIRSAREPEKPLPAEIDGVQRDYAICAMRDALLASGSAALRTAIAEHGDDLVRVFHDVPPKIPATAAPLKEFDR